MMAPFVAALVAAGTPNDVAVDILGQFQQAVEAAVFEKAERLAQATVKVALEVQMSAFKCPHVRADNVRTDADMSADKVRTSADRRREKDRERKRSVRAAQKMSADKCGQVADATISVRGQNADVRGQSADPLLRSPHTPLNNTPLSTPIGVAQPALRTVPPIGEFSFGEEPPPSSKPDYATPDHELWAEGPMILVAIGAVKSESAAKKLIGQWRRDTKEASAAILRAIQQARDHQVDSPIPWITKALGPHMIRKSNNGQRLDKPNNALNAALAAEFLGLREPHGAAQNSGGEILELVAESGGRRAFGRG